MALTPETRPLNRNPSLAPAQDIIPQVGVYYDALGTPQRAYMLAPPPPNAIPAGSGAAAPTTFSAVTPSDTVPLPPGVQGLYVSANSGAQVLWARGIGNPTAVSLGSPPAGTTIRGQFQYVMAATTVTVLAMV